MKHKKNKLVAILLIGIGLTEINAQTMYVKENSGTQTSYSLSNIQKLTFSTGNLTVHKTDNTTGVYSLSGLKFLSFKDYTTWINEPEQNKGDCFITYPNPTDDYLFITLSGSEYGDGSISILSITGKILQRHNIKANHVISVNLESLPQGIYLCRYSNDKIIKTVKIIKKQ